MIVKVGDKYVLLSKDGKERLGEFAIRSEAEDREKEIIRAKRAKALDERKSEREKPNLV